MANFNINSFQTRLAGDGARPNLFQVSIPSLGVDNLSFLCKAAQLPGSTLGVVEVPYFGRALKLAGNRTFAEWTVTVINDEDFAVRDAFMRHMGRINSHEGNVAEDLFDGYTFDAEVKQYGKTGDVIKRYTMVGAWPTDVSPIELDWGSNDTIEEFQVTFAYQYWKTPEEDEENLNN